MCGIVGIYNLKPDRSHDCRKIVKKMADTIIHRGPDDEGYFSDHNVFLGHRRLSIVDLTAHGHQPMTYDHGNLTIVYNGEVYNYIEIRQDLVARGYRFKSRTDTEVILAAYQEWGPACLDRFNGMWAFVIYDKAKQLLFGARDRLGVKPFYYFFDKKTFIFASEIKAILAHPKIIARPNDQMVWKFLMHSRTDYTEETIFDNIMELKGGYYFICQKNKFSVRQYWDLKNARQNSFTTQREFADKFRELFLDSVSLRLRSDVPVGTCLSGGLDSSAIVCAINLFLKDTKLNQIGPKQQTFSACYENHKYPHCDERKFIREVIRKTQAKSNCIFPQGDKLTKEIKKVIWHQDLPFYSTSIYAQWNVFRLASQKKVKVVLDGQGSDEFLAGYLQFFSLYFFELIRQFKFITLIKEFIAYTHHHQQSFLNVLLDLLYGFSKSGKGNFLIKLYRNRLSEYTILNKDWRNKYAYSMMMAPTKNVFKNALYTQAVKSSLPSLLRFEDRNSMAFSIESRVPFLDYRLAEFMYSLPDNAKINQGQTKWIMRQALKGILPEKIIRRQDKIGFATPEEIWLKENFHQEFQETFQSERFLDRSYIDRRKAGEILDAFNKGKIKNYQFFWRLYCLEMWFRVFIDKEPSV